MRDARGTVPKPAGPGVNLWAPGREQMAFWLGVGVNLRVRLAGVQGMVMSRKAGLQQRYPWARDHGEGLVECQSSSKGGVVRYIDVFFLNTSHHVLGELHPSMERWQKSVLNSMCSSLPPHLYLISVTQEPLVCLVDCPDFIRVLLPSSLFPSFTCAGNFV